MGNIRYAYLCGSDAHVRVDATAGPPIGNVGSTDIQKLRTDRPKDFTRLHITKNYFRQEVRYRLGDFDCLLNLVTDPEQNPKVLAVLAKLLKSYGGRVINRPEAVLRCTREKVNRRLSGLANVIAPSVLKISRYEPHLARSLIDRSDIVFPAILRRTGTHSGHIVGIVASADDVIQRLRKGEEYNLTSFVDFRSPDGIYRKYRFFFFGDRIVFRHLVMSDHWNVHAADRERFMTDRPELLAEELAAVDGGFEGLSKRFRDTLLAIREQVGLDFFGLDCSLSPEGEVIVFEANATMNFVLSLGPPLPYPRSCLAPAQQAVDALLRGS